MGTHRRVLSSDWTHRLRRRAGNSVHRLALRIEPVVDEDPQILEVALVDAFAAAPSPAEAWNSLHAEMRLLDEKTIYLVLMLLVQDLVHCSEFGGVDVVRAWVERRRFDLMVVDLGQPDGD